MVSSGADGLIKLWTIRTLECEATMDAHLDRVWALDITEDENEIVSGGADSRMVVWTDNTLEIEREKREEEEANVLMEQTLANHLRNKEFDQALEMVLSLDKPRQALKVRINKNLHFIGLRLTQQIIDFILGYNCSC